MNNATQTPAADVATTEATTTVAPAAPKEPSKKSQALAIFNAAVEARKNGEYATNKEFRAAVLSKIQSDLGVSTASAATMYNAAKKDAETAGVITLGRDPKKEKPAGTGKRGRPAGSKNKTKTDEATTVVVDTAATTDAATAEGSGYAEPVAA